MEYIQPLNEPANSPYSNGNAQQGTQGSIIPAQAIENPQREIVNVIQQAFNQARSTPNHAPAGSNASTPDSSDLTQLYQAIRQLCAPAGDVRMWAGSLANAPKGFLVCDGQAISRTIYSDLYAVLGDIHGAGDGSTSFNVPNLQDKFVIGRSATREAGTKGGSFTTDGHAITIAQMPSHSHTMNIAGGNGWTASYFLTGSSGWINGDSTRNAGGNAAHSHGFTPPYYSLIYIIRT